ncbi:MAG: sugar phosphate nucleotidyltransferase [Desulfobacterales bacterium]|jgi:aminoglycoside/choline kinase family phosphotransferase/GTP:adenosylcobinamide-phosphate guanylyltransferase
MKALILSAGLGTRLRPYTHHTPKPLFTICGRPLLDIMITKLIEAGCESIMINTHHLHGQIEAFVAQQNYTIPIEIRYEQQILGTGGAIINVKDFWNDRPFMVINADIVTKIDIRAVYDFHCQHRHPVTLVLADDPEFNSVKTDANGFVTKFYNSPIASDQLAESALTFTGIQVLDREILKFITPQMPSSSIDAYTRMLAEGKNIKAYISHNTDWKDIGTPERYKLVAFETMVSKTFQRVFPDTRIRAASRERLKGDGSDRRWYRLKMDQKSMIVVDHGIRTSDRINETDAFVNIGRYLFDKGLPVPQIYEADTFAGYVFLEDLGNLDLQKVVRQSGSFEMVIDLYRRVVDLLTQFSKSGADQFNSAWCYQTSRYGKSLILENECRYFVEAFLKAYLGLKIKYSDLKSEFEYLAENALEHSVQGLMHRDFQSRNIMIKNDQIYLIDFQGARMGPIQYDLASLLIDPYVGLPQDIQTQLLAYALEILQERMTLVADNFNRCYRFCSLTRNLQILGAFAHLTGAKGKMHFEKFIPAAVRTLERNLKNQEVGKLPMLIELTDTIIAHDQIKALNLRNSQT